MYFYSKSNENVRKEALSLLPEPQIGTPSRSNESFRKEVEKRAKLLSLEEGYKRLVGVEILFLMKRKNCEVKQYLNTVITIHSKAGISGQRRFNDFHSTS